MRSAGTLQSVHTALRICVGQRFVGMTDPGVSSERLPKAEEKVKEMCKKLLANLVIEDYKIIESQ